MRAELTAAVEAPAAQTTVGAVATYVCVARRERGPRIAEDRRRHTSRHVDADAELTPAIGAPAPRDARAIEATREVIARGHGDQRRGRHHALGDRARCKIVGAELTVRVGAPAPDGAVAGDRAGMTAPARDRPPCTGDLKRLGPIR